MIDISSYRRDTALKLAVIDAHDRMQENGSWRQHYADAQVADVSVRPDDGDAEVTP